MVLGASSPTSWFNQSPGRYGSSGPTISVFVSYSQRDTDVAGRLRKGLEEHDIKVIIDSQALRPGKSIQQFIEESVCTADATVAVVSKYSLVSAWVALEAEEALSRQRKSFFGCFVDEEFLRPGFVDEALNYAELQTREIGRDIKKRIDRGQGFDDLYRDWERNRLLRTSIDKVVGRLRNTACLSLQLDVFNDSVTRLVKELRVLDHE